MAIDVTARARVVGIDTKFKNLSKGATFNLPQRIALVGQGNSASVYSTTKRQVTSAFDVGTLYGFGSPLHLAAKELFPVNGDGVGTIPVTVYPLVDDASGVAASGDITITASQTVSASYKVKVNNIESEEFVIASGDAEPAIRAAMISAINAVLDMPVIASDGTTKVDLDSKWEGTSANDLYVEVVSTTETGIATFAYTQPTGGLVNPDVDDALNQIGDVWETLVINCMDVADTTSLGKYQTFGDGRWGQLTRKPLVVFTGNLNTTVSNAIAVPDARKTDKVNAQIVAPGSKNLPFVVAARGVARIAVLANNNPATDYGRQELTGITPGLDSEQWDYTEQDTALKGGSSTGKVVDGVLTLADTITFYHPDGDPNPAYRYVVDIIKLMNVIYNLDLEFTKAEWDGAPLIPDNQVTTNPLAKQPKMAVAAIAAILDNLGLDAIISDPKTAKANTSASIDSQNPKRLNVETTVQLSGNTNIISVDLNFGFFFG